MTHRAPRTTAIAGSLLGMALLASCSSGVATAAEDDGFVRCVDDAGASLDGSDDWGAGAQLDFWAEPGTLDCALDELDDQARAEALAGAFREQYGEDDGDDTRVEEWQVLGDWAALTAGGQSLETTLGRSEPLLGSLWSAEYDDIVPTNRMAAAVVTSAMRATGELPSYERYLVEKPDAEDDVNLQVFFMGLGDGSGFGPSTEELRRYNDLRVALVDAVRD